MADRRCGGAARPASAPAPARGAGDHAGEVARLLPADRVVMRRCSADSRSGRCGCAPAPARRRRPGTGRGPAPSASQARGARSASAMRAGTDRVAAGAFGQPDHAEPQRLRPGRAGRRAAAPVPANRRRCRPGRRRRSGCRTACRRPRVRPPRSPDSMRIATPGIRSCEHRHEGRAVVGVAHRGGGQHLERVGAHGARDGVRSGSSPSAPARRPPRSAGRCSAGRGPAAAPPFR